MKRNPYIQAVVLIAAAAVLAVVANAFASRDRKLALVGWYPNALKVPPRETVMATPSASPVAIVPNPNPQVTTTTAAPQTATTATTATAAIETVGLNPAVKMTTAPAAPPTTDNRPPTTTTTPAPGPRPPAPETSFTPHPDKPYVEIGFNDVKALYDRKTLFLDARRTSVYEQGHVAGARPFSVWESDLDEKVNKLFEERSDPAAQAQPIVVYCSGGECEDSHMLAQKLWGVQFNNVYVYKDGFPDWQQRGGAIHSGANP